MSYRKPGFALGSRLIASVDEPPTNPGPDERPVNVGTQVITATDSPLPPVSAREAFAALHPQLSAHAEDEASLSIGVVGPSGVLVAQDVLRLHESVTIGRHSECRILIDSPSISLRHLVVYAHPGPAGVRVCLWDLQTGQPFRTEDGAAASAVVADGPLFVTLGAFTLAFIANSTGSAADPDEAWAALLPREFAAQKHSVIATPPAPVSPADQAARPAHRTSQITRVPAPCGLAGKHVPPDLRIGRLTIATERRHHVYDLALEDLRRGVLIGRYDRCHAGHLCEDAVSRVHLLIVAVGDAIHAFDTASSNGTECDGVPVASVRLRGKGTLVLAGETTLAWEMVFRATA